MINRREVLLGAAAAGAFPGVAFGEEVSADAQALYARAIVLSAEMDGGDG